MSNSNANEPNKEIVPNTPQQKRGKMNRATVTEIPGSLLGRLASETVMLIAFCCPKNDLLNLRLACLATANLSEPAFLALFKHYNVAFTERSFQRLMNRTADPAIAQAMRWLRIGATRLPLKLQPKPEYIYDSNYPPKVWHAGFHIPANPLEVMRLDDERFRFSAAVNTESGFENSTRPEYYLSWAFYNLRANGARVSLGICDSADDDSVTWRFESNRYVYGEARWEERQTFGWMEGAVRSSGFRPIAVDTSAPHGEEFDGQDAVNIPVQAAGAT